MKPAGTANPWNTDFDGNSRKSAPEIADLVRAKVIAERVVICFLRSLNYAV